MDEESKKIVERIIVVIALGISCAYGVLLALPSGWHTKVTQVWSLYMGLHTVDIKMDTLVGSLLKWVTRSFIMLFKGKQKGESTWAKYSEAMSEGTHSIQQLRDQFCNIELMTGGVLNSCWVWSQFLYGCWAMIITLGVTIVFLVGGAGMMLAPPTKCIRMAALGMFCIAAVLNLLGTGAYVLLTINMNRWLHEIYGSHDGLTFSMGSVMAVGLSVACGVLPLMVWFCSALPRAEDEEYYDYPVDAYGNPLPCDQYGNPLPVDQYGNPIPVDKDGNPMYPDGGAGGSGYDAYGGGAPPQGYDMGPGPGQGYGGQGPQQGYGGPGYGQGGPPPGQQW